MIFKLFPNPNSGVFDLDIQFDKYEEGVIHLYDIIGNKVWSEEFEGKQFRQHLFLPGIIASTYYLVVETATEEWMKEMVIY